MLISDVSKNEVYEALQSLPSSKSPGPNGLNAEFFRFYQNDIKDTVFTANMYFFEHSVFLILGVGLTSH